jgi:DNA-binding LytR/AlgR family response regulator
MHHTLSIHPENHKAALHLSRKRLLYGVGAAVALYGIYCYSHAFITGDQPDALRAIYATLRGWVLWIVFTPILVTWVYREGEKTRNPLHVYIRVLLRGVPLVMIALVFRGLVHYADGSFSALNIVYYHMPKDVGALMLITASALWFWWRRAVEWTLESNGESQNNRLEVLTPRGRAMVKIPDVDFLKARGNYIEVYSAGHQYLMRTTMEELEKQLAGTPLVRTHRSFFANTQRVRYFDHYTTGNHQVVMENGLRVPVSKTYRDDVRASLQRTVKSKKQ